MDLTLRVHGDLLRQVALGDRAGHRGNIPHLLGQVERHQVDVLGEVLPDTRNPRHVGLTTQPSLGADLAGQPVHLVTEARQLVDHRVDGVLQCRDLTLGFHGDLLRQVALGHGLGDTGDVADLVGQVPRQLVDVLGEVPPRTRNAVHLGLPTQSALGADFAGDPGDLVGEARQLVDHRVDGVLQLQDLTLRGDGDLLRQVALGHGRGDGGDVADLVGQVRRHRVHVLGEVLPGARDPGHLGLTTQLPFRTDLPRHPGHFLSEHLEGVGERVDRVGQFGDFAFGVDVDGLREVTGGDRVGDPSDGPDLIGQVRRHRVHRVGQAAPTSRHPLDIGLTAQLPVDTDLTGHPGDLVGELGQQVHHAVDGLGYVAEVTAQRARLNFELGPLGQVPRRHRVEDTRDLGSGANHVLDQTVDGFGTGAPGTVQVFGVQPLVQSALPPDDPTDQLQFTDVPIGTLRQPVEPVGDQACRAFTARQPHLEVAGLHPPQCVGQLFQ